MMDIKISPSSANEVGLTGKRRRKEADGGFLVRENGV